MGYIGTPIDTRNQFQSLQGKRFNGDGSTTDFTLDVAPSSTLDLEVFVGNVRQDPNSAYTVSGTTLSFTGAPPSGTNNIYVVHQAKSVGTIDVPALGVSTASIQADAITEAKIADDAVESEHLNDNIISGQTALGAEPADTDEFLVSDAGTIKRVDYSYIKAGDNTPRFYVYRNGTQAISNNTYTVIQFNAESAGDSSGQGYDSDSTFDSSTNYRFTPAVSGKYFLHANASTDSESSHNLHMTIRKNGSAIARNKVQNTNRNSIGVTITIDSDTNDYFDVELMQDSGGGRNILSGYEYVWFTGFKLA